MNSRKNAGSASAMRQSWVFVAPEVLLALQRFVAAFDEVPTTKNAAVEEAFSHLIAELRKPQFKIVEVSASSPSRGGEK